MSYREEIENRLIIHTKSINCHIISYGLVVQSIKTGRWLLAQRKHTVEILLIMRGNYRNSHLPLLVTEITKKEADQLRSCIHGGTNTFDKLYLEEFKLEKEGLEYGKKRMSDCIKILSGLLNNLTFDNELEWNWPKGRPYPEKELPLECAKREFYEEIEVVLPPSIYISNYPVTEHINTITGKHIESKYWIYLVNGEFEIFKPENHEEIEDRRWVTTEECKEMICNKTLFDEIIQQIPKISIK